MVTCLGHEVYVIVLFSFLVWNVWFWLCIKNEHGLKFAYEHVEMDIALCGFWILGFIVGDR